MHRRSIFGLALLPFLAAPPLAAEEVACPPALEVPAPAPFVEGWRAISTPGNARQLERLILRQGGDAASASIPQSAYFREERGESRTIIARWDLQALRQGAAELWLACAYSGTVFELTRRLPEEAEVCEYRMDSGPDGLQEKAGCW